jgi:hypothetical protein
MELREALTQITEIRSRLAHIEVYRGYRSAPVAFSGFLALAAGLAQGIWLPNPGERLGDYLTLWIGAAAISLGLAGLEMAVRLLRKSPSVSREATAAALNQLIPVLLAGGFVTAVITRTSPQDLWILPGLWQVFYSLGVFASARMLPRAIFWVGVFYLFSGCFVLALGPALALRPWAMAGPFFLGQFLAAAILYINLERDREPAS